MTVKRVLDGLAASMTCFDIWLRMSCSWGGGAVTALLKASLEVLPFLLLFLALQGIGRVSGMVGLDIHVCHIDYIYYALCPAGPETSCLHGHPLSLWSGWCWPGWLDKILLFEYHNHESGDCHILLRG